MALGIPSFLIKLAVENYTELPLSGLIISTTVEAGPKKKLYCIRAVKLKIFREEWDYCFHFSFVEVLDFVKDV